MAESDDFGIPMADNWKVPEVAREVSDREHLLLAAVEAVTKQRNNEYGPPTQDFDRTAALWSVLFRNKIGDQDFQASDVAVAMIALKLSRITWSPEKMDNWLDVAGYAGCGWECAEYGGGPAKAS